MFKVKNINTPDFIVYIVNFEYTSRHFLMFLLLTWESKCQLARFFNVLFKIKLSETNKK